MKLIVQIPCLNEEGTLPQTLAEIPRELPGVDEIRILVIDDGSSDRTVEIAREHGVDHIVRNTRNLGLARSFRRGIDEALRLGADIIVNTDGDNQYAGGDIGRLIAPILDGQADIVIGNRQTSIITHFSPLKRFLQSLGSRVVSRLSGIDVPDAVSGFRALSREAALSLNIVSTFSYTTEMIIQAGWRRLAVSSVPVRTNPQTRESRLFGNLFQFLALSSVTIIRSYAMYKPLRTFFYIGSLLTIIGAVPAIRFLYFYLNGAGGGHVQSLVLGAAFLSMGFVTYMAGLLADLISVNRQLLEISLEAQRRRITRLPQHERDSAAQAGRG